MTSTTKPLIAATRMDIGLLALRTVTGLVLIVHGTQKLLGWLGGSGLDGAAKQFASMGYSPPEFFSAVAALTEVGGGMLLILGLLTPLAAAAIIGEFLNAIVAYHIPQGFLETAGDYPLILGTIAVAIAFTGPGAFSMDHRHQWIPSGINPVALSLGLGFGMGILVLIIRAIT